MTTDIVERLRSPTKFEVEDVQGMCLEAADALEAKDAEIERLRERLKSRERFAVFFETQYRENPRQTLAEFIDAWRESFK